MKYFLTFVIGFILSGVWFGCHILIQQYFVKKHLDKFEMFLPLISAFLPTVIICAVSKMQLFHILTLGDWKLWGIALFTICLTSVIILFGSKRESEGEPAHLLARCVEAAFMEIPQRAMMQTFVCTLLFSWGKNTIWCILINACIWCMDIFVQAFILKQNNFKKIIIEVFASFTFSIGIGYVFWASGCLVIPMFSHALERYATNKIKIKS